MNDWLDKALDNPENMTKKDRFAVYYGLCGIMAVACRKVGISTVTGYEWKDKPSVAKKISLIRAKSAQKADISLPEVLNEAYRILNFDIKDIITDVFHDKSNDFYEVTMEQWKKIDGRLVKEVKPVVKDGIKLLQLKFYDKIPVIKMLLDHFKEVKPEQHVHVHLTPEELKTADPGKVNAAYQELMGE